MSRISQVSDRRNRHLDRPGETERASKAPLVHLFAQNQESPLLAALQQQLKNQSYESQRHADLKELKPIVEAPLRKVFVVICREGSNDPLPNNYKPGSGKMVRICTLGGQEQGTPERPNFQTVQAAVRAIGEFAAEEPATIRLASVHSIRVSKDKKVASSRDLKEVATSAVYLKVFYFKNYRGEYLPEEDDVYEKFVEELGKEAFVEAFKSARDLEKLDPPKGKRKHLVLASTNQASIKVIMELKKAKLQHFHYILLGRLNPCQQFLDDSVLLASSDPRAHVDFLIQNNFGSPGLQAIADRLGRQNPQVAASKPQSSKIVQNQYFQGSKIEAVEPSKVAGEERKKVRKIKSPGKGRPSQIQPDHEHDQSTSNVNLNIVVSKHTDEPIIETEDFRTNKQGERIYKKESVKEVQWAAVPQGQYQTTSNYFDARMENAPSRYDAMAPAIDNQFAAKKASNIESKYRNPSVIIQEMSDEYRGSNKESIMNLEPEKPRTDLFPSEPMEENTVKKVVSKGITYANQPETHYISSNRTIEYTRTNQIISDPNINEISNNSISINMPSNNMASNNNIPNSSNMPKYVTPTSPRVISGSPMTISSAVAGSANTRVYGRATEVSYQSPSRVIRKEITSPEEIVESEQKSWEENRVTFGSNFNLANNNNNLNYNNLNHNNSNSLNYNSSNGLNYSNTNSNAINNVSSSNGNINNISSSYRNPQPATSSSYYTPQTFNYHTFHNEPYSSKIHVSPGRVEQIGSTPQRAAEETKTVNYLSPPKVDDKGTKQFIFNSADYDQIERDGRIVYRKKVPVEGAKYTPVNYVSPKIEKDEDGSPTVKRYEAEPLRRETHTTTTYDFSRTNNPQTYEYRVGSNTNNSQPIAYDYGRMGGTTTTPTHTNNNNNGYSSRNYEVITVPYKTDEHHLGEMIESSHKKKTAETSQTSNRPADNKNFVTVSYRNEDRSGISSNYKDTGVRVYGVTHPRVEVERMQQVQPRVESAIPSVITPIKAKPEPAIKPARTKQQLKGELSPALTPKNALNESNWFSRMSELHSDGSILRRNNIRFGVKLQKREEKEKENSVVENKLVSGIYKVNDLNKKMALNRIIQGEEYIQEEREKYAHINPSLNRFHLLLQEDLDYLHPTLAHYLARPHDRIDSFAGVNSLFSALSTHSDAFDLGFVFARQEEMAHINPALLPENYFLVSIEGEEGLLEINEGQRRVRVDQLRHFPLVQRIILDSQLYQYVAYRNSRPEVELLADKFVNSEFILEKIETEFTTEILDCYYYELPRLTRLYVLCDESQLPGLLAVVQAYSEVNPGFKAETCKLVCVLSNILGNEGLIMAHPTVTFISNPEEITHFRHILGYAHHYDAPDPAFLPIDYLFYHAKHAGLQQQLVAQYPGRFAACPFGKVAEVYGKVEKAMKVAGKHGHQPKFYLVLHESVNAEKVRVEYFTKIFMLGKAKVVQNKVVRVMNIEELLELLKK